MTNYKAITPKSKTVTIRCTDCGIPITSPVELSVELCSVCETGGEQQVINSVKIGEFLKRKRGANKTYIRGRFHHRTSSYSCIDFDDHNHEIFIKSGVVVWTGFTF